MKKRSAGLLVYRRRSGKPEVLLARMGGPWFTKKEEGAWTIPKGEYEPGKEDPLTAAKREFSEELGKRPPDGDYIGLGEIDQRNNKTVIAWAVEADIDVSEIKSNKFKIKWPPGSGRMQEFPEIERAEWLSFEQGAGLLLQGQAEFLNRLASHLGTTLNEARPAQDSLF